MPSSVRVTAPGKINLHLAVGPRDQSGYHPLATVFQAIDLADDIVVRTSSELTLTMLGTDLPADESNLAVRAARLLARYADVPATADITIHKRIPVAGGMAGGSADAAGTLVALDALWGLNLTATELQELGIKLGADVPFCLLGGTALGVERGDALTPLLARGRYTWIVIAQEAGLSTPLVFEHFDRTHPFPSCPEVDDRFLRAIAQGDTKYVAGMARNDLAESCVELHPGARAALEACAAFGLPALVSGSGPTVVALADDDVAADVCPYVEEYVPGGTCLVAHGPVSGAHVVG